MSAQAQPVPSSAPSSPSAAPRESLSAGLGDVIGAAYEHLVDGLAMRELSVPDGLGILDGEVRGATMTMTTRAYGGAGFERLVLATIVDGAGRPASATIIGLPEASALPILGVDLIALGGKLSLAAIDLAPTDEAAWAEHAAPLLRACQAELAGKVSPRRWPSFAREVFSPLAQIVAAKAGAEEPVFRATVRLLHGVAALTRSAPVLPPDRALAAYRRRLAWQVAERSNRREHDALSRIFGAEAGERYLRYLFGAGEVDDVA